MILVTGDIHGPTDIGKLASKENPFQKQMTKEDFLIIAGDFGLVWDNGGEDLWWRKWLDKKPYTTLFVDGNHENFDLLYEFEEVDFCGGRAHRISDSIYHLMRGEMFELQGKRFFTMGGAESHDKAYRTLGVSLWEQELPNDAEYAHALDTLEKHGWQTDFVITHCAPTNVQCEVAANLGLRGEYANNRLTDFLQDTESKLRYVSWFCGHYHTDMNVRCAPKLTVLYNSILQIV